MTKGKKALSDIPKNHRMASRPLKFMTEVTSTVKHPKANIMQGRTRLGPSFFPKIPKKGAVRTYGTKKTLKMMLYWSFFNPRVFSSPAVFALPRFDLSRLLNRYMTAKTGRIRRSNFHTKARSAAGVRRTVAGPSSVGRIVSPASFELRPFSSPLNESLLLEFDSTFSAA